MGTITIFKNIFDKQPNYISVDKALERIKEGRSKVAVDEIRTQLDKERANRLKCNLPSVCFSGKFSERTDSGLIEHSGFMVLDFDGVQDLDGRKSQIIAYDFVYACWVSPSGNGLKALVRIADGKKHREHFVALREIFKDADRSGANESRVCYESYDPEIYINKDAKPFAKITTVEQVLVSKKLEDEVRSFENILKWLSNKGDAFIHGSRNQFIYKLAGACCRFGIVESDCRNLCRVRFLVTDNTFSQTECDNAIRSAYRKNKFGIAEFSGDVLVDKTTRQEIETPIDDDIYNLDIRPKDVIFGEDVKHRALKIYDEGYEAVMSMGIPELDEYFKFKRGEISLLSGIGNYGKSSFLKYLLMVRIALYGEKWAMFSPEDNPPEEFYHDFVEIYLGAQCTPLNPNRPTKDEYEKAYDYVSKHIFYVYPKDLAPTPAYIKERFLELIIKEQVNGCVIDPFNQMTNEYGKSGGRSDKYLETLLSDFHRFAQLNGQYFVIVAHPHKLQKDANGNYPCPDVFDIADGAMWNNKMDNILIYHRPNHQKDPSSTLCELHTKKIRRQKSVGKKGTLEFELDIRKRRFRFGGIDHFEYALRNSPEIRKPSLYEEIQSLMQQEEDLF
jgi:hypothetical protein